MANFEEYTQEEILKKAEEIKLRAEERTQFLTKDKYYKIDEAFNSAMNTDIPIDIVDGEQIAVIGDANKTEKKPKNYKARFRVYNDMLKEFKTGMSANANATFLTETTDGNLPFKILEYEFKNIFIKTRNDFKILLGLVELEKYFVSMNEKDSNLEDLSLEERAYVIANLPKKVVDALFDVSGALLDLSGNSTDALLPEDAYRIGVSLFYDFPEVVKHSDAFFGLPTENTVEEQTKTESLK